MHGTVTLASDVRVPGERTPVNIHIAGGRITGLECPPEVGDAAPPGQNAIAGDGRTAIPAFVDPHLHLDKALLATVLPNRSGTLGEAIRVTRTWKTQAAIPDIRRRAEVALQMGISRGTTRFRTHVDIDEGIGLRGLEALLDLRQTYAGVVDLQLVAFPQEGLLSGRAIPELLEEALRMGADAVGGIPHLEFEEHQQHVDRVFAIALKHDVPVDLHVDETDDPGVTTIEYVCRKVLQEGYGRRTNVSHLCSLAALADTTALGVIENIARAGITVVALPSTNLYLQGRDDTPPVRRGVTRIRDLLAAGVTVALGSDNICDPFNPFGNADPLDSALIAAHAAHMGASADFGRLLEMVTGAAAAVMGIDHHGIAVGSRADFILCRSSSPEHLIRTRPSRELVFSRGRVISREETVSWLTTAPGLRKPPRADA